MSNPGGNSLRRAGRDPWRYCTDTWRAAIDWVRQHPAWGGPHELILELQALRDRAEAAAWRGQAGATQRMVLLAIIDLALKLNQIEVNVSQRYLVEITARSGRKPISKALRALEEQGWLLRVSTGRDRLASRYRLLIDGNKTPCTTSTSWGA